MLPKQFIDPQRTTEEKLRDYNSGYGDDKNTTDRAASRKSPSLNATQSCSAYDQTDRGIHITSGEPPQRRP